MNCNLFLLLFYGLVMIVLQESSLFWLNTKKTFGSVLYTINNR